MDERTGPPAGGPPEIANRRRLLLNTTMSVVQVVVVGVTFIVLYRFVRDALGIAEFGVWALVLTTSSVAHLANLGLTTGTVKFVAQYLAAGDHAHVSRLIQTAVVSVALAVGVVALIGYPIGLVLLARIVEPAIHVPAAQQILPYGLLSFWLLAVSAVVQSSLDGHHRVYLRNLLLVGGSILYLVLAFLLVPRLGLVGLALAQVAQAAAMLFAGWLTLRGVARALPIFPIRWNRGAFREMLGYSLNMQVISIAQILFVPVTKILLSKFGGIASVGNFEFAYRMVIQLRAIIATAHEALVPALSDLAVRDRTRVRTIYIKSFRLLLFLLIPLLPLLIASTPVVSRLWIGGLDRQFVIFADLLFLGWFLNMLANPAYYGNMGSGELKWNVRGHFVIGVLSPVLGTVLGWYFAAAGVVAGFVIALLTGSVLIALDYHRRFDISLRALVENQTLQLTAVSILAIGVVWLGAHLLGDLPWSLPLRVLLGVGYLALVAAPVWRHPMRQEVAAWLGRVHATDSAGAP